MKIKNLPWKVHGRNSYWTGVLFYGIYYIIYDEDGDTDVVEHRWSVVVGCLGSAYKDDHLYTFPNLIQAQAGVQEHFNKEIGKYIEE